MKTQFNTVLSSTQQHVDGLL